MGQADAADVPVHEGYGNSARRRRNVRLALDEKLAEAHSAVGWIKWSYDWDWSGANAVDSARAGAGTGERRALDRAGVLACSLGRFDEALQLGRRAAALDPLRSATLGNLGDCATRADKWEESAAAFSESARTEPRAPRICHAFLGRIPSRTVASAGRPDRGASRSGSPSGGCKDWPLATTR